MALFQSLKDLLGKVGKAAAPAAPANFRGTGGELPKDAAPYERWAAIPDAEVREALANGLHVFVQSSNVEWVQYRAAERGFTVHFLTSPNDYTYQNVPPEIVVAFFRAGSKGKFVNATFVKTKWPFIKT